MASSRWSAKETRDFVNHLRDVDRNIIGKEDIQNISLKMNALGYRRNAEKYFTKYCDMKRNHPNPDVCKVINGIVAKERAFKESKMRSGLDSDDDDDHGSGDANDQEADDINNIFPSTSACSSFNTSINQSSGPHHFLEVDLDEGKGWQHPINTAKKQKTATSLQSSFGQNPQGTNSPGASTSTNLKRRSDHQPKIFKDNSGMILKRLLEEKDWKAIKIVLQIGKSLSHQCLKTIGNLALAEGQTDVLKICWLKMEEGENSDESHDQE
ncbi:uncharacterized protein [Procambarus clarkii]|uniref:uncharacterized protein isoform X1 n=1 Tax=Procambarus clarkii TaxID=6728 RepID=UPI003742A55E